MIKWFKYALNEDIMPSRLHTNFSNDLNWEMVILLWLLFNREMPLLYSIFIWAHLELYWASAHQVIYEMELLLCHEYKFQSPLTDVQVNSITRLYFATQINIVLPTLTFN